MTGPIFQRRAMAKASRRRSFRVRPGAAALALSAALAIPALTVASGPATAATAAGAAAHKVLRNRLDAGQAVTARASAAGTASRTVLAWGRNTTGQLGDGTTTSTSTPVKVHLPAGTEVTQVRAGCEHSLALTSEGQVLAWGYNHGGELGDGSTASSDVPVRVALPAGVRATAVSAEEETSLARTSGGGGLFGWGDNSLGQLGDGTTTSSDTPVRVDLPGGWRASAVSSGPMAAHALVIVHKKA